VGYSEQTGSQNSSRESEIGIAENIGVAAKKEAKKVKLDLQTRAKSLFEREPIGWDLKTLRHLYNIAVSVPEKIPQLKELVIRESRMLGMLGSLLVLGFLLAVFYSLYGQKRATLWVERKSQPVSQFLPERYYPYFLAFIRVAISGLIPLILLALFSLIDRLIDYQAPWFLLTGRLLLLWAAGAITLRTLNEILARNLFETTARYGKVIFHYTRLLLLYLLAGIALFEAADVFKVRADVIALIRFVISLSVIFFLFLIFLKKKTMISFLPPLAHTGYRWIFNFLNQFYFPLLIVSAIAALIWCAGYPALGKLVLVKVWLTIGALLIISLIHYGLDEQLLKWLQKIRGKDESAEALFRTLKSFFLYTTVLAAVIVMLNLLGLLMPLKTILSFPIFQLGPKNVTLWILMKAILILLLFVLATRLLQAYMDYKIYPALGIDPGLGYALNTFIKYVSISIGFFISVSLVGIDLRFLLVFAGAAGIGIGLGLQSMAANIVSGFTIIFGGKIRKGDWIEVNDTMGIVTNIYLRATMVRSRDNIEYLIPNSFLISNISVNYSLTSPLIRIALPVGVSYGSDPGVVEKVMLKVAENEPLVSNSETSIVRFIDYGDSSINFELLFWIDIREVPRRKVKSALYFALFDEFKKAGIEIPFPQRDIHIRSKEE